MSEADPGWVHDQTYFDRMYAADPDPWGFDDRWYERRKQALTMALLPDERYQRALEPGCANGALTIRLAERCDEVIAYDPTPAAVDEARCRLADRPHVTVLEGRLPELWPAGGGDLVVLSEVAYYLSAAARSTAAAGLERWLVPGGTVVAVHWTGPTDYPMTGVQVAEWMDGLGWLDRRTTHMDEGFEAAVWTRRAPGC